ncbi:adhesion G protein-coupled receptor F5-like [Bufo bufo]|uniref:adhesion G protein-coupled receptor F5-like n=1 Tax=Bufo bufo TaxID=8384 RepID=UPI001ABE5E40|nr:adhesion G protein-coupled receptor F5-like [Bufo bufo]
MATPLSEDRTTPAAPTSCLCLRTLELCLCLHNNTSFQSTMTMLSSLLYLFIIHLSFGTPLEVKAEDLGGFSHPPVSEHLLPMEASSGLDYNSENYKQNSEPEDWTKLPAQKRRTKSIFAKIFRTDNQESLIREKRAATDLPADFEADIELSFPDFSMAAAIRNLLETSLKDLSLGQLITISSVDVFPEMPNIKVSPDPIFLGDTGMITCNFGAVVNVTWYHNSTKISDDSKYTTYFTKQGSTVLYQLRVKDLTGTDAGTYNCSGSINGTIKNMSTVVHISKIIITASPNIETFCDGSKLNISCCSSDIDVFNVTWEAEDAPGTPSGDSGNIKCFESEQLVKCEPNTIHCVVTNKLSDQVRSKDAITISLLDESSGNTCKAVDKRPETPNGHNYSVPCMTIDPLQFGNIIYLCEDGTWGEATNECFSEKIFTELQKLKNLVDGPDIEQNLPLFLENLKNVAKSESHNIARSSKNMEYMVEMISTIANQNLTVSLTMMENFLQTVDIVVDRNSTSMYSFTILKSMENFATRLQFNGSAISIKNENIRHIQLFGQVVNSDTKYDGNFSWAGLNGRVTIKNGTLPGESNTVVTIAYSTMKDLLPPQDNKKVNALVMSTVISNLSSADIDKNVFDITMTFTISNESLKNPDCSWLDLDNQYWRSNGCITIDASDGVVKCSCNHLTSFSILMGGTDNNDTFLAIITYIGVAVSIVCLVITLVIEAVVWRSVIKNKTSYMRHVCLVNIAVTLLIADIWFIIGAQLEEYPDSNVCITAAFFTCYFYLCLFFWMLVLGLILFYRLIYILHDISRRSMMIIAFTMGYGCPLLIAVIAVASTAPRGIFTDGKFCWLSKDKSGTFLAFVVPALTIVFINLIILIVVIVKLLRPAIGERPRHEERQNIVAIAKSIAVLTPLLGTSWALGLGVSLYPNNTVIHGIFAAFNSLQGLFILISIVLLDQNVRKAVRSSISTSYWSTLRTKVQSSSTNFTASPKPPRKNIFKRTGGYHFNFPQDSSSGPSASSLSLLT